MQTLRRDHIRTVIDVVEHGLDADALPLRDEVIRSSWQRCVREHRLDPTRPQETLILPQPQLREHQERIETFLRIARRGIETLYRQVAGLGYCVLLTDARGVTVDFIGDLAIDGKLRGAGLYLGSDWSEPQAGTNGVGTAIATGQALTVHLDDHFDATHIPLSCTTAPVFDPQGALTAVLDVSALSAPPPKASQHLALQIVQAYAHDIENANFMQRFRSDWILKLADTPEFLDLNPQYLLAVDAAGRVIGHNRRAQQLLEASLAPAAVRAGTGAGSRLVGASLERLLELRVDDLPRFARSLPSEQRAVLLAARGRLLFLQAVAPPAALPARLAATAPGNALPAPLRALSLGDAALERQLERAARLANSPVSVLLHGETGTGKEYLARALHEASERRSRPFVAVNCAAIPETLIESELFGHLPGSFSGAAGKGKRGLIQEADSGTLFLDEIGDMPRELQGRLLRVLAEREVLPVGATRPVAVNIRVIAATHCDLRALVREGRFREDLYYRLTGAQLCLPPLRERSDRAAMLQRMLEQPMAGAPAAQLSDAAALRLAQHDWPGNLREMHNVVEFARTVCREGLIELIDLPDELLAGAASLPAPPAACVDADADADDAARRELLRQLRAAHWNISAAARAMGLARMTLYRRMQRWGIEAPNKSAQQGA